jgi:hypothetical protein
VVNDEIFRSAKGDLPALTATQVDSGMEGQKLELKI